MKVSGSDQLDEVILNGLDDFDGPICVGLHSGHVSRANVTLTLGAKAELNATLDPELRMLESAGAR